MVKPMGERNSRSMRIENNVILLAHGCRPVPLKSLRICVQPIDDAVRNSERPGSILPILIELGIQTLWFSGVRHLIPQDMPFPGTVTDRGNDWELFTAWSRVNR